VTERPDDRRPFALESLRIASPCTASWEAMAGDDRVRHCGGCRKNVYDLSAMARGEAEALVREKEGRLCVRLRRREDGTVITGDCPRGLAAARRRLARVAAAAAALFAALIASACGRSSSGARTVGPPPPAADPPRTKMGEAVAPATMGTPEAPTGEEKGDVAPQVLGEIEPPPAPDAPPR
jgi:hypothetical protein